MPGKFDITVLCLIVAIVLFGAMSIFPQSTGPAPAPATGNQGCFEIVVGRSTAWLLDRCEGDSWRYDAGWDRSAADYIHAPSWRAMNKN